MNDSIYCCLSSCTLSADLEAYVDEAKKSTTKPTYETNYKNRLEKQTNFNSIMAISIKRQLPTIQILAPVLQYYKPTVTTKAKTYTN